MILGITCQVEVRELISFLLKFRDVGCVVKLSLDFILFYFSENQIHFKIHYLNST